MSQVANRKLLTVNDVAKVLRVSRPTIYNLINSRKLKSFCPGGTRCRRIRETDLDEFIQAQIESE